MKEFGKFVKIVNAFATGLQNLVVKVFKVIPQLIKKILETK